MKTKDLIRHILKEETSHDDLMTQLDPTIKKTVLQNRLVNKGSTQVRDKIGNYVTVTYPNFMEERYRRRLEKMIMEMIEKSITL